MCINVLLVCISSSKLCHSACPSNLQCPLLVYIYICMSKYSAKDDQHTWPIVTVVFACLCSGLLHLEKKQKSSCLKLLVHEDIKTHHSDTVKLTYHYIPSHFKVLTIFLLKGDRLIWRHHPSAGCPGSHGDAFQDHWGLFEEGETLETPHLCSKQVWPHPHLGHGKIIYILFID